MHKAFIIFILFICLKAGAQNWAPVSKDKCDDFIDIVEDTVHHQIFATGRGLSKVGSLPVRGLASWNGIEWDSLSGGINTHEKAWSPYAGGGLNCSAEYHGKLLVGGVFFSVGGINTTALALWDGVKWDSLPKRAFRFEQPISVSAFLKKDGLLYIAGDFDTIAGKPAQGLATWDGINFNPVSLPTIPGSHFIYGITEYKNEIYITGDGFNEGPFGDARDVYKFNGTSWVSTTGKGFNGSDGFNKLMVFNNELYAAGHLSKSNGNVGNTIIKWNGTEWKDIGFGPLASYMRIQDMLVYHNKLWVFGGFNQVAGVPASNVATYDGVNWCALPDTIDGEIYSAFNYRDTIFIGGGFHKINSDTDMEYIAKLQNPDIYSQCVNVGIKENNRIADGLFVYPNPAQNNITIQFTNFTFDKSYVIYNNISQIVSSGKLSANSTDITLLNLSSGMYILEISDTYSKVNTKLVKE